MNCFYSLIVVQITNHYPPSAKGETSLSAGRFSDNESVIRKSATISYSHLFYLLPFIFYLLPFTLHSQSVGIFGSTNLGMNTTGAHGNLSSVFDISSTTKGILIPRVTLCQRTTPACAGGGMLDGAGNLPAAAQGLLVYQTDGTQGFYHNTSTTTTPAWVLLAAGASGWSLLGNANTTDGTNFIGTTDDVPLNFRMNNQKAGRIDDATSQNTFLGYQTGNSNTDGKFNTFLGFISGSSNTTGNQNTFLGNATGVSNTTGSWNVFVGDGAGNNNNGNYNTFLGTQAGLTNIAGERNTFLGYYAGYTSDNTNDNTFLGYSSGASNATGQQNTFVGASSGLNNITGDYNTATGYYALFSNTIGAYNTANGLGALSSNTIGNLNTASGQNALTSNTDGNYNTANGVSALYSNTIGNYNTASGQNALYSNVAGSNATAVGFGAMQNAYDQAGAFDNFNVAVGFEAMRGSPTAADNWGNYNIAIGYQTLWSNTTGNNNIANGFQSLFANTTGNSNTAMGYFSLFSNETGNENTAIGPETLTLNTTGSNNTAIGSTALNSNQTGIDNVAVGGYAGQQNTASYNTFIGTSAGSSNETGARNTYIGNVAGTSNINGSNNTFIGDQAGTLNIAGSGNVFIGKQAGFAETGSNKLYIANTSGTPLIYGDFSSGYVGIGTIVPEGLTDIFGDYGIVSERQALMTDQGSGLYGFNYGDDKANLILSRGHAGSTSGASGELGYVAPMIDFRTNEGFSNEASLAQIIGAGDANGGNNWSGSLLFATSTGGSNNPPGRRTNGRTPVVRMILDHQGYLGIGITTPTAKLDVLPSAAPAINIQPFGGGAGQTGELRFFETVVNGDYVGFKAPDVVTGNKIWTLPAADGASGQYLSTNGSGVLSWSDAGTLSGGITDYIPKWTGANSLGNSAINDDGTRVQITSFLSVGAAFPPTNQKIYSEVGGASTDNGVRSINFGTGNAGIFEVNNSGSSADAVSIITNGSNSKGINISHTGTGGAGTDYGLYVTNTGVSGSTANVGGYFSASGANNNYAAIFDAGNVGIGTTVPAAKLDVAGDIKISNSAATCNATTEGSQRYNSTSKKMEYCNGSSWIAMGDEFPAGAVIYMNGATCPTGWTEYAAVQGRYIVGLPAGGSLAGTQGTALSNLENRAVGQHNHTITDPGHGHSTQIPGSNAGGGTSGTFNGNNLGFNTFASFSATTGILINNAGSVAGTNAPYIQLRACQKN